jgi:hypothetical protein
VARRQFLAGALALAITFGGIDEMSREKHRDEKEKDDDKPEGGPAEPLPREGGENPPVDPPDPGDLEGGKKPGQP